MTHTPGPWKIAGTEIWAGSKRITLGNGSYDEKDRQTKLANARLIAAAPEMLEALINLVNVCPMPERETSLGFPTADNVVKLVADCIQAGKAAIAKAEGRGK